MSDKADLPFENVDEPVPSSPVALDEIASSPCPPPPSVSEIAPAVISGAAIEPPPTPAVSKRPPLLSAAWDLLHDVSITVLFCFFIVTFVAQPVRVQGASMQPRIEDNERILVNKFIYRFQGIERGDVVVFYYPRDPSVSYIKRVIGLPGDRVEIMSGSVLVNGVKIEEPYLLPEYRDRNDMPETTVERGHYFMMGDHRSSSMDSRSFGPVPEKYIYGKAAFCVWPIAKTGRVR